MILIDTSVWIDFFRARDTFAVKTLINAIEQSDELYICGVIFTEILQGIQDDREFKNVKELLSSLIFLEMTKETFIKAAEIYRLLRVKGITIRKTVDCLIAAVALEHNLVLLHHDKDFHPIEKYCGLKTISSKIP